MKLPTTLTAAFASCLLLPLCQSCGDGDPHELPPARPSEKPLVYTTFYPTLYFARRIAGDRIRLACTAPRDADPLHWQPEAETVKELQTAELLILNGAGMETWLGKVSLAPSRLVDTSRSFRDRFVQFEESVAHKHGPGKAHTHEGTDAHVWLDPLNALAQARAIRKALALLLPGHAAEFGTNFEALSKDLQEFDANLKVLGALPAGKVLVASHPAYNYLASRYGWKFVNFDLDPMDMPDAAGWQKIRAAIDKAKATHMLWESLPNEQIVAAFKTQLGLVCLEFSPCEAEPEKGDYLSVMRGNLERLRVAFE